MAFKQALSALRRKGAISLNGLLAGNFDLPIFDTVLSRYTIIDASTILLRGKTFKLPQQRGFIDIPTTVGEHIRKKKMELGLFQTDVARMFNVSAGCITYWENNRSEPQINYYPLIIEFLGYFPLHIDLSTIHGEI